MIARVLATAAFLVTTYGPAQTLGTASPQSINGRLFADGFPGADEGARINAALSSAGSSVSSVVIDLKPGLVYPISTILQIASRPAWPTIDCHGSTLQATPALSGRAMAVVAGQNAQQPGETGGPFINCRFDSNGVKLDSLVQVNGRLGVLWEHNFFEGKGTTAACVKMVNTNTAGGPGYTEGWGFIWNGFSGCTDDIALHRGAGGADSFDYGWIYGTHFQLAGGQHGIHVFGDEGHGAITLQGLSGAVNVNTAGGPGEVDTLLIDNGSTVASSSLGSHGENTGGNTWYDVRGVASVNCEGINTRASSGLIGAQCTMSNAVIPDKMGNPRPQTATFTSESGPLGRAQIRSEFDILGGQQLKFYGGDEGGAREQQGITQFKLLRSMTSGSHTEVKDRAVLSSGNLCWEPNGNGVMFGGNWCDEGTPARNTAPQPTGQYGAPDIAAHNLEIISPRTVPSSLPYALGWKTPTESPVVEYSTRPFTESDLSSGAPITGTPFTGACTYSTAAGAALTVTFHVINGRIVSCN
jgi:hypothetical protein